MRFFTASLGLAAAIASASALTVDSRGDDQVYGHDKVSGYGHQADDNIHAHIHVHEDDHARKGHGYGDEKKHGDDGGYGDLHQRGDDDGYGKSYGHGKDHHRGKSYGQKKHQDGGYGNVHKRGDDGGYGKDHHRPGYGDRQSNGYGGNRHGGGYGDAHKRGEDGGYGKEHHRGKGQGHGYGPRSEHLRAYSRQVGDGPGSPISSNGPMSSNSSGPLFNSTSAPPDTRPGANGPSTPYNPDHIWPHCARQCPGNPTQCRVNDWDCICTDQQWLHDNKECFQQNCDHGDEYEKVKQLVDRHCNQTTTTIV